MRLHGLSPVAGLVKMILTESGRRDQSNLGCQA